ncbi:MAG: DEAD/DEAH box helicase [Aquificaceae bacterium]
MNTLYEWQRDCLEVIKDKNAIVSAPTGAGKTRVAYLWMEPQKAKEGRHRIIYTTPIKALANQKVEELIELYGKDLVGIETGDIKRRENAPILVCTQEIYTRKYAHKEEPMRVVIDEFHYIFSAQDRARAYIQGIAKAHSAHKILIMSATLGNPQKLRDYLFKTTSKDFALYETSFRPTKLTFTDRVFKLEEIPPHSLIYILNTVSIESIAKHLTTKLPALPLYKRRKIKLLADEYKVNLEKFPEVFHGVARYYSRLTYTEKRWIERLIKEGFIHTCFATNALGVGVNLPFQWVLFGGVRLPGIGSTKYLSKTDFLQLSGRAGRKGYFDEGFVGFLWHDFHCYYEDMQESLEEFLKLKDRPMEEPNVVLKIDVEAIVKGQRTPEEEYQYILHFSEPPPEESKLKEELERIKKELSKIQAGQLEFLKRFYIPELDLHSNIELARMVLSLPVVEYKTKRGKTYKARIITPSLLKFLEKSDQINSLLLKRKVLKMLNRRTFEGIRIRCLGIVKLEDQIKALDPLLLEVGA